MKKLFLIIVLCFGLLFGLYMYSEKGNPDISERIETKQIQNGDLIFQTSLSQQSKAIQLATNSVYSHCGIIYEKNGKYFVFEAIQPVQSTPLEKWISRGKDNHYVIKRLKNSEHIFTKEALIKMKSEAGRLKGKDYDLTFEWSDNKMYCSELIWKIYNKALNIDLGKLQKLEEFDLSNPVVKKKLTERYGNNIPKSETVISPKAIFESNLLFEVIRN